MKSHHPGQGATNRSPPHPCGEGALRPSVYEPATVSTGTRWVVYASGLRPLSRNTCVRTTACVDIHSSSFVIRVLVAGIHSSPIAKRWACREREQEAGVAVWTPVRRTGVTVKGRNVKSTIAARGPSDLKADPRFVGPRARHHARRLSPVASPASGYPRQSGHLKGWAFICALACTAPDLPFCGSKSSGSPWRSHRRQQRQGPDGAAGRRTKAVRRSCVSPSNGPTS